MVGSNLKEETLNLMNKRTAMETDMNSIIERLCRPGGPGLSGNLVDSEGFPRTDVDISAVRAERGRLSELRNDHMEITNKIDENIQILHSSRLAPKSSVNESDKQAPFALNDVASASANIRTVAKDVDLTVTIPFAMVDEIADASPAAEDGLQLGDQIVKFGSVEVGDNLLQRLASEAQNNQRVAVPVLLMRQGAILNISVTPRTWQGRGLLGCHFQIL